MPKNATKVMACNLACVCIFFNEIWICHGTMFSTMPVILGPCIPSCLLSWDHVFHHACYLGIMYFIMPVILGPCIPSCLLSWDHVFHHDCYLGTMYSILPESLLIPHTELWVDDVGLLEYPPCKQGHPKQPPSPLCWATSFVKGP